MSAFLFDSLKIAGGALAAILVASISGGIYIFFSSWRYRRKFDREVYNLAALERLPDPEFNEDSAQWRWIAYQLDKERKQGR